MADVLENYDGDPTRKLIYLILANHANDQGICWPSIDTVAQQANVSRSQAFRHIAALRNEEKIEVQRRKEQSSIFKLLTSVNRMGATFESRMGDTQNRKEIKQSTSKEERSTNLVQLNPLFDEFWKRYPRKVGKGDARRAFEKALKKVELPFLLAALDLQKRGWDDPKFIPFPATWLNGERWDDEIKTDSVLPEGAV